MQHEVLTTGAFQCIDDLGIALRAQGGDHQGLGLATGEQGGAVGSWQNTGTHRDRTNRTRVTPIDTGFPIQDTAPDKALFQLLGGPL